MAEERIIKKRIITTKGNLIEVTAWKVPKSLSYPEGIKYSYNLISDGKRIIAIDNYNNEGHHVHIFAKKIPYIFRSIERLDEDFFRLVDGFENEG
ncbi:hypothetical protein JXB31_04600 [Candidatus Woesearchaeota archaeon]|nr:hypothetical protein [Candidatus Woesearchaeota archaeon]